MFSTILVTNRGEIACRVIRTARRMGIRTVAVSSEADQHARHVRLADEAVWLGPAPARESYLVIEKIIDAARRTGAQAIHPGYGFLSENADFAEACAADGLVGEADVAGVLVGLGRHSDGADPHSAGGADHSAGDFASIGDQDGAEHAAHSRIQFGWRFDRNASMPSWPSALARCRVIA